jgi:cytochrome P450
MTGGLFDLLSPGFARDPSAVYARLRERDAPLWDEALGLWLLPRFDWVAAAALDKRLVRSPQGVFAPDEVAAQQRAANWHDMPHHSRYVQTSLLDSDGPVHDRLRKLVFREFTAASIARLRDETATFVAGLLDRVLAAGEVDFVADFASHIPGHVIGRLLGAPDEDCAMLCSWSENIVQYFDLDRSDARKALAENTTVQFCDYLMALAAARRHSPRDDLLTRLAAAEDAGAMSRDEFISTAMLILMAGHGSSIDVMSSGMHALLRAPDQMARLRADPALLPLAVQEMFRFEPPLPFFHRYASEDVELAGKHFPKGTKFGLLYGAANRDPAAFADPDRFDVARTPNRHLAFGYGAHLCLGNHIARMTMETVFGHILSRTNAITLLEEPLYKRGLASRGPQSLRVTMTAT